MNPSRLAAATAGEKIYFSDPCRRCGNTRRYVLTGQCAYCVNERSKANAKKRTALVRELIEKSKAGV